MKRRTPQRARCSGLLLAALLATAPSCTFVVGFVTDRCDTDSDCESKGDKFAGTTCYEGACRGGAAPAAAWACVGAGPTGDAAPDAIEIGLRFVDLASGAPLAGVSVVPCARPDASCGAPLAPAALSDGGGRAELRVPTSTEAPGGPGFDGYFLVSAEGRESVLLTFYPPLRADREETTPLGTAGRFATLSGFSGADLDPGRGNAVLQSADCEGRPGEGVLFAIEGEGDGAQIVYGVDGAPSEGAAATDEGGNAFALNLPPGHVAMRSARAGDELSRFSVLARPGFLTIASVAPDR